MSDIGLFWDAAFGAADLRVASNDLATDGGLETAVLLSLFTDRRAEEGDVLPSGETDRRGWWADELPAVAGDRHGSRLWLLAREKDSPEVLQRAQDYAREALAWLVEDLVAERVDVSATSQPHSPGRSELLLDIRIQRPTGAAVTYRYNFNWATQEARRLG